jgi:peptidoglycan/LPS O-acetylase OafA/YrhL
LFKITAVPELQGSYRAELWNWYAEFKNFSFPLRTGGEPWFTYNFHAWSIPVEHRGSLAVYTAVLAFSRFRRDARLLGEVALVVYFLYVADGSHYAMFIAGMLLKDLDLLAMRNDLPRFFLRLGPFKTAIMTVLFYASLYLGGVPSHTDNLQQLRDSPGWYLLSFLKPQAVFDYKWFYLFWAAVFLVACTSHLQWLKTFFNAPFNQYLGRISFAFYLVHGPVLWTLGDRIYAAVGFVRDSHYENCPWWINRLPLPNVGPLGLEVNFLVANLVLLPLTIWLAEVTTRLVDEPAVKFSQWIYQRALIDKP